MTDVTGGSLARRPAFFLSASLGVALVIGFLGWSATCPCDRMPGGYLFGTESDERVADWNFANAVPLYQFQIRTRLLPHSINLNCMSTGAADLYLSYSECDGKRWSAAAVKDGRARIRLIDSVYPVALTRVQDPAELDRAWSARLAKLQQFGTPDNPAAPVGTPRPDGWWNLRVMSRV